MTSKKVDIINVPIPNGAIILNESNINTGTLTKNSHLVNAPYLWHKIVVQNIDGEERDVILKTITDSVHPMDLIPVFYQSDGTDAHFLVRNCGEAIADFCKRNLLIYNPNYPQKPYKLMIILAFSSTNELKVNVQDNIMSVLDKRYNAATKMLNLDNFYKDPGLGEFCMLSQPKILYFVLHLCRNFKIQTLKLSNNEIKLINPIHAICSNTVTSLDLRNNLIESIAELESLKTMQITELWLDGNPLCEKHDEFSYIQGVRDMCPKIEKLDGMMLGQNGCPAFRRNFLSSSEGLSLVDQFVEHFFTLYDSNNRGILEGLYHKNAAFSLTANYLPGQLSSPGAQLTKYIRLSRNIMSIADVSRVGQYLHVNNLVVLNILKELPPTEHDPFTFTVDLLHYTEKTVVLVVGGVFREPSTNLLQPERFLGFTRMFVLVSAPNGEYNIINEMLNITNATTSQQTRAFKVTKIPRSNYLNLQPAQNEKEQIEMTDALKQITNLNLNWAKKCLEECHYNLKNALKLFVDLYKVDKIPEDAFTK